MQRALGLMAVAALATLAPAAAADAQDASGTRAFRIGVQGGVSLPLGAFGDDDVEEGGGATTGFNVAATIGIKPAAIPVGLQFDLGYNRFGIDDELLEGAEGVDANWNILSGTANAVLEVPTQGGFRPYLIGGVGMYKYELKVSDDSDGSNVSVSYDETDVGLNGGVGFRFGFGTLAAKLEARYHTIFAEDENLSFLPIAFGIEF